jgi:hypothetical protein
MDRYHRHSFTSTFINWRGIKFPFLICENYLHNDTDMNLGKKVAIENINK